MQSIKHDYKAIRESLLRLCENEGLVYKEADLFDNELIAVIKNNVIIFNSGIKEVVEI